MVVIIVRLQPVAGVPDRRPALNFTYLKAQPFPPATATYTATSLPEGDYEVYAWWVAHSNRATDAPYTINYDGGTVTVEMNQQETDSGGQWQELTALSGPLPFATGVPGSVVLTNDANEYVIADAVRFEFVP